MAQTQGSNKAKTTRSKETAFDFTNVEVADGASNLKTLRKSKVDDTPFPKLYAESWETGKAKVMILPEAALKEAAQLASAAGRRFGIQWDIKSGVRTRVTPTDTAGMFQFEFIAVDRTKDADPVEDDSDTSDETEAETENATA